MEKDYIEAVVSTIAAETTDTTSLSPYIAMEGASSADVKPQCNKVVKFERHTKDTTRNMKAESACQRISFAFARLAHFATALVVISIGLFHVSSFVNSRLERAQSLLELQSSVMHREQLLYGRLDNLLTTQLSRGFMENHETCLVRGLDTANDQLLGLGFLYPEIRNQTMDWTMENCARLFYVPQPVAELTVQQIVLTSWARSSYRARKMAEQGLSFVKRNAQSIWSWLFNTGSILDSFTPSGPYQGYRKVHKDLNDNQFHSKMPFGFDLSCERSHVCRLVFPHASNDRYDRTMIPAEVVETTRRAAAELFNFQTRLHTVQHTITVLLWVLIPLQYLLVIRYGASNFSTSMLDPKFLRTWSFRKKFKHWLQEEKTVLVSLVLELFAFGVCEIIKWGPHAGGEFAMIWGLFLSMTGFSILVSFLVTTSPWGDISRLCSYVKKLRLAIQDNAFPTLAGMNETFPPDDQHSKDSDQDFHIQPGMTRNMLGELGLVPPKTHCVSSLSQAALIIKENMQAEFKVVQEDQKTQTASELEDEDDSESDTEDEDIVDLAGGITPTITEGDLDWSIVDV
ncbi:hypothetical protein BKA66DRAFT_548650 [Pyrenochaeta sp. MPI-SDFR-AT-0127]|nr:hypothetical protein BKA66DRAFT_548650 [Pyrenochaeta sp. MPI-SDFR-AT-0127]